MNIERENAKEINTLIMQEIGLEVGARQRLYDQDTGAAIRINGLDVVAPGCFGGSRAMEFNPYENRRMMNQLFDYFLEKRAEETDIDVLAYYTVDSNNPKEPGTIECKMSNDKTIQSRAYRKDTLKYADLIMQLNGEDSIDLSKYDVDDTSTIKKPQRRSK